VAGIKEDVVDIMLNLKNVKVKVHTDDPIELRLEKKGAGPSLLQILKQQQTLKSSTQTKLLQPSMTLRSL
jgi:DNA-directed RNA polymerase alpha subunit